MITKSKAKKLIAALLTLLVLTGLFAVPTSAISVRHKALNSTTAVSPNSTEAEQSDFMDSVDFDKLSSYLIEKFASCPGSVSLSQFNIPSAQSGALIDTMRNNIPELFHIRNSVIYYSTSGGIITALRIYDYPYDANEYAERLKICEKAGSRLLYNIEDNDELSDYEKAVLIHDRLIAYCEYAYDEYLAGTLLSRMNVYGMDGVLVERSAVCNGYALAYMYLAKRAGIKCDYCSSKLLNHGWDIVYIDGEPYHLDTTWDDPVWDSVGRVMHNSLLLSTDAFMDEPSGHSINDQIDYDATPVDTTFDDMYWRDNVISSIIYIDGMYYYIDGSSSGSVKLMMTPTLNDNSNATEITAARTYLRDYWSTTTGGAWASTYSKLSSDGRDLYFNSSSKVYKYDIETEEISVFYEPSDVDIANHAYIYGFYYDGTELILEIAATGYPFDSEGVYRNRKIYNVLNADCAAGNHLEKEITAAVEPTCTTTGRSAEVICVACAETLSEAIELPLADHNYEWVTDKEATCGADGEKHQKCTVCQGTASENTVISATGNHNYKWVTDKEATCGADGAKHQVCTVCSATANENTVIPATGNHNYKWVTDKEATCGADGSKHQVCTVCSATASENTVIAKIGHTDKNNDGKCDVCKTDLGTTPTKPTNPSDNCSCNCHKSGITNFFWKIGNFFHKLFGMKQYRYCDCGKAHW